jgi:hypothetical protein
MDVESEVKFNIEEADVEADVESDVEADVEGIMDVESEVEFNIEDVNADVEADVEGIMDVESEVVFNIVDVNADVESEVDVEIGRMVQGLVNTIVPSPHVIGSGHAGLLGRRRTVFSVLHCVISADTGSVAPAASV